MAQRPQAASDARRVASSTAPITRPPSLLDLSYAASIPVILRRGRALHLWLVGCGGSGSWLAPSIARLAAVLRQTAADLEVGVTFVDPDTVEEANVPRQNFCWGEIGRGKAAALAVRYSAAWGLEIAATSARFDPKMLDARYSDTVILAGCVDNAAARRTLAEALNRNAPDDAPGVWLLECGNDRDNGQVLLGCAPKAHHLRQAFSTLPGKCVALPSPALQCPALLQPRPGVDEFVDPAANRMSCAELTRRNAQSLTINQRVAAEAADFLMRLVLTGDLRRFATYFDAASGSARSKYVTPESVAAAVGQSPANLFAPQKKKAARPARR